MNPSSQFPIHFKDELKHLIRKVADAGLGSVAISAFVVLWAYSSRKKVRFGDKVMLKLVAYPKVATIEKMTDFSESAIREALKKMELAGIIARAGLTEYGITIWTILPEPEPEPGEDEVVFSVAWPEKPKDTGPVDEIDYLSFSVDGGGPAGGPPHTSPVPPPTESSLSFSVDGGGPAGGPPHTSPVPLPTSPVPTLSGAGPRGLINLKLNTSINPPILPDRRDFEVQIEEKNKQEQADSSVQPPSASTETDSFQVDRQEAEVIQIPTPSFLRKKVLPSGALGTPLLNKPGPLAEPEIPETIVEAWDKRAGFFSFSASLSQSDREALTEFARGKAAGNAMGSGFREFMGSVTSYLAHANMKGVEVPTYSGFREYLRVIEQRKTDVGDGGGGTAKPKGGGRK